MIKFSITLNWKYPKSTYTTLRQTEGKYQFDDIIEGKRLVGDHHYRMIDTLQKECTTCIEQWYWGYSPGWVTCDSNLRLKE